MLRPAVTGFLVLLCLAPALSAQRSGGQGANAGNAAPAFRPNRIIGRILGPTGAPVTSVIVSVLERDDSRFGKRFRPADVRLRIVPNERGEYSIDLAPGPYYVVAMPVHEPTQPNRTATSGGYAVTYHPGTTDVAAARQVTVTMSRPVVADITLRPAKPAVVSGTVRWSDGLLAGQGRLGMSSEGHLFGLNNRGVALQRDGTFQFGGVTPGRYCLQHVERAGGRGQPPRLVSAARISVSDRDLTNVRVVPVVPVSVKGRLILAQADRPRLKSLAITVTASPIPGECYFGTSRSGTVLPTGAFEFFVEPVDGYVRVWVNNQEIRPAAVRHNGIDVPNGRFQFSRTAPVSGIEVELGPLPPSIAGNQFLRPPPPTH